MLFRRRFLPRKDSPFVAFLIMTACSLFLMFLILPPLIDAVVYWHQGIQKTAFVTRFEGVEWHGKKRVYKYTLEVEGRLFFQHFEVEVPVLQHVPILVMPNRPQFLLGRREDGFWAVCQSNGISLFVLIYLGGALYACQSYLKDWLRSRPQKMKKGAS